MERGGCGGGGVGKAVCSSCSLSLLLPELWFQALDLSWQGVGGGAEGSVGVMVWAHARVMVGVGQPAGIGAGCGEAPRDCLMCAKGALDGDPT